MSKELEALEQIKASHFQAHIESENIGDFDIWFEEYYNLLRKALTPPTVDEMCFELNERYFSTHVYYIEKDKKFAYGTNIIPICWLKEDGTIYWATNDLTPRLIILICRFYEGDKK